MTTVEIWSDWACPFCWIGKTNLDLAFELLDLSTPEERQAANITLIHKAFLLNPKGPLTEAETQGRDYYQELEKTKGWSLPQVKQIFGGMTAKGKALGLEFNFDSVKNASTRRGHLALKLIEVKYGDKIDLWPVSEKLFQAYFRDGVDFKDSAAIIKAIGLDDASKDHFLTVDELEAAVVADKTNVVATEAAGKLQADLSKAAAMGISGVPLFVFNSKISVSGAQPPEALASALSKAMKK